MELRERMDIESGSDDVKWNQLRWLGHVLQKDDGDWVKKGMGYIYIQYNIYCIYIYIRRCERERKVEVDVKSGGGEG